MSIAEKNRSFNSHSPHISDQFSKTNPDFKLKWIKLLNLNHFNLNTKDIPTQLIPNFIHNEAPELKESFFIGMIILVSECQITFEQMVILTKKLRSLEPSIESGLKKFQDEEFYHSLAYRHYLNNCKRLKWKGNSLLIENKSLSRKLIYLWVKRFPKSLYLVGAKLEIFSLNYSNLMSKTFEKENSWRLLNEMHLEDEAYHIPFAMKIHNDFVKRSPLKLIIQTYIMFILVQLLSLESSHRLIKRIYPKKGFLNQLIITFKLSKWIIRDFGPYKSTRKMFKANMKKFKTPKIFRPLAK